MHTITTTAILILAFTFSLSAQSGEWNSLDNESYSIEYPGDWILNKSGQMGTSFILFSPVGSQEDQFRENVTLVIQDLSGQQLNLKQYVEISEEQIKTMITDGNILLSEKHKKGGLDYQKVIYTGKQGTFNLEFEQFYFVTGNKAYVLTLSCEEDVFADYQETGEKILESFELK